MNNPTLTHDTISIERTINASAQQVFDAWADPAARSVGGPPSTDEAIEFLENDFRVGGKDVHVCGQKGELRFRVETLYHDIEKPSHLLFSERVSTNENTLCASLITVDLAEAGKNTNLEL